MFVCQISLLIAGLAVNRSILFKVEKSSLLICGDWFDKLPEFIIMFLWLSNRVYEAEGVGGGVEIDYILYFVNRITKRSLKPYKYTKLF